MAGRVGGIITVKIDSQQYQAKGNFTYDIGAPLRAAVVGHDKVHGYSEIPKVAFIAGEFTDDTAIDTEVLANITGATVTLDLANGKTIMLRQAWFAEALEGNTEEGNMSVRFEAEKGFEIPA